MEEAETRHGAGAAGVPFGPAARPGQSSPVQSSPAQPSPASPSAASLGALEPQELPQQLRFISVGEEITGLWMTELNHQPL